MTGSITNAKTGVDFLDAQYQWHIDIHKIS